MVAQEDPDMVDDDELVEPSSSLSKKSSNKKRKEKKSKKDKKKKKSSLQGTDDVAIDDKGSDEEKEVEEETKSKKKDKKSSKKDRKRRRDEDDEDDDHDDDNEEAKQTSKQDDRKEERKKLRQAKLSQKEEWMSKIPKVDQDGISYTKMQIRKMLKRVKKGLNPILTEEEERQRKKNEIELQKEEEAELVGMIYKPDKQDDDDDEDDEGSNDKDSEHNDGDANNEENQSDDDANKVGEMDQEKSTEESEPAQAPSTTLPAKKKAKRSKPVPADYTCSACKNRHQPAHWIYDCPDKVTMRGTNQKKKKLRGLHEPDAKKVFVSGLPFDVKSKDIVGIFQPYCGSTGKVVSSKLIAFKDTGRCNGQAYIFFDTEEAAAKALKASGTTIDGAEFFPEKKKNDKGRKELKLKVSRVLNRRLTKGTTVK